MRIADPRPSLCTTCGNTGSESTVFVDTEAVREGPAILDAATGQIAVDPKGAQVQLDDVFICDACVRAMADLVKVVIPDLHRRQLTDLVAAQKDRDRWRAYAEALEQTHEKRPEPVEAANAPA